MFYWVYVYEHDRNRCVIFLLYVLKEWIMNSFTCFSFGRPLWKLWAIYFFHKRLVKSTGNGDFSLEDCWLQISLVWWVFSTSCCLFLWVWQLCLLFVCFIISVHFCILSKMWNFKYGHSHFPFNRLFLWNSCASPSLLLLFTVCFLPLLLVSLCRALTISGSSQGTCCAWLTPPPHPFLRPAPGFLLWFLLIFFCCFL